MRKYFPPNTNAELKYFNVKMDVSSYISFKVGAYLFVNFSLWSCLLPWYDGLNFSPLRAVAHGRRIFSSTGRNARNPGYPEGRQGVKNNFKLKTESLNCYSA